MVKRFRKPPRKPQPKAITNELIKSPKVRLIGETGENLGIVQTEKAIALAKEKGLSLIQVAETPKETIAKIADLGKYLYQQQKSEKKQREKQRKDASKTVRLKLATQAHDLETKAKQVKKFLDQGYRVQIEIFLRGRERSRRTEAEKKLKEFIQSLEIQTKTIQQGQGPRGPQAVLIKI
ncbi:MAG: translation initiation factor IF-3 [Patescibacteria group bacterium]